VSESFPAYPAGFRPGSLVAGYRLEALAGTGGMAVVFRARDVRLDRLVALKILGPARAADPAFRRRFLAESRAAAKVDDPHIIPVYEAGEAAGALFIAMRFVRGGDLRGMLAREGAPAPARAAELIVAVASALDAAHAAGLVHRDVKPANILVDAQPGRPGHVYLSDFGIAKAVVSPVSLTGQSFIGTADYAAPEQIDGKAVDGRTDQYALACVAYQLLTGAPPFARDQPLAVMAAHLHAPPPSAAARRPGLPGAVDKVLARGMAKAPDQRYDSCGDFAAALGAALGLTPHRPGRPAAAPTRPQPSAAPRPGLPPRTAAAAGPADPADPAATVTAHPPPAPARPARAAGIPAPAAPRRRRPPRRAVRLGVPAAAAVIVIAAAVLLLARKDAEVLADRGDQVTLTGSAFAGYPGQRGAVTVSSIAPDGAAQEAAGSADGRPAIWRRSAGGAWALVSAASPAVSRQPGTGRLAGVAHGPAGWVAVGEAGSGAAPQPVVVTSADGVTWQAPGSLAAFAGPPGYVTYLTGAAAGPGGYVVVGRQVSATRTIAAMWWSAGLRNWVQASNGGLDGRLKPSTARAAAATGAGFVAAGTRGAGGALWTSADGRNWTVHDQAAPAGASAAVLRLVAAAGGRVAAAGQAGPAGAGQAVTWRSPDGLSWQAAVPAGGGIRQITALSAAGGTVTGAAQQGAAPRAVTLPAP